VLWRRSSLHSRVLLSISVLAALLIIRNWAYVTTYRLYVAHRVDRAMHSTASQRFDVEGGRVSPQIVVHDDDAVSFGASDRHPSTLYAGIRADRSAEFEVRWSDGVAKRVITSGTAGGSSEIVAPIPAGPGTVTFVNHGAITWVDPRLVRDLRIWPYAIALVISIVGLISISRETGRRAPLRAGVAVASGIVALVSAEGGLRLLGDHLPAGIAAERHDLGEVHQDERWVDTPRYGRRFRANVSVVNEWRYGDIVRMGFIPPDVSDAVLHRFPFRTDREGFRNDRTRDRIDVAALGDSFTDGMTLSAEDGWTRRLEALTGLAVQNYGTAGFGPQQELMVLKEVAIGHRPRIVVLGFFAGNDIFDAEAFDEFERSGNPRALAGWQIKDVVSRADTWFLVSALHAAASWTTTQQRVEARAPVEQPSAVATSGPDRVTFDRGMFTAVVSGSRMRFAFMPPYVNTLTFSERELTERDGWRLTRESLIEMRDAARRAGSEFVVMFLPFKSQVYLPWLRTHVSDDELVRSLRFYLPDRMPDIDAVMKNRLAQNRMMRAFCEANGISLLDATDALQARFLTGANVYFPDESHLNETGHAIVADALAQFLSKNLK